MYGKLIVVIVYTSFYNSCMVIVYTSFYISSSCVVELALRAKLVWGKSTVSLYSFSSSVFPWDVLCVVAMTITFSTNQRVEQDLSKTKTSNWYCFLQQIDALPNRLKLGMDVELCLRKSSKEESERLEEATLNQQCWPSQD